MISVTPWYCGLKFVIVSPFLGQIKLIERVYNYEKPLSIFIKYKTTVTPKINILISSIAFLMMTKT
jgi:hypothetical protein